MPHNWNRDAILARHVDLGARIDHDGSVRIALPRVLTWFQELAPTGRPPALGTADATPTGETVPLGRVDREVVIEVFRMWETLEKRTPLVERDLGVAAVADARPGFGLLRVESHGGR